MTNDVAIRALDESQAHVGPPRPHASFGPVSGQSAPEPPTGAPGQISTAWELRQLQRRSRDVLRHKLILDPAAPVLSGLGHELLSNIRRIQDIERMADAAGEPRDRVVPLIHDLIRDSHHLLDVIVGQISLCDSTAREALAVAEWGRRLTLQEPIKLYKLLPLFDRVCDEIRRTRDLRLLVPLPGLHLASVIESQSGQADVANFTTGLLTARVLVWTLGDGQRPTQDLARLVLAALLQDVGRLPVVPGGESARALRGQRSDWLEQQHPTIAAALFGSIRGAPIELPILVAQHHEQLDGGGFPRALTGGDILADAAILAAAGRFAELCQMASQSLLPCEASPKEAARSSTAKSSLVRAADALLAEAEWGKWPREFASSLARYVAENEASRQAPTLEVRAEVGTTAGNVSPPSTVEGLSGDRLLQLHNHEKSLQGTHADSASHMAATTVRDRKQGAV